MWWLVLSATGLAAPCSVSTPVERLGAVLHPALNESSGVVESRQRQDVFFTHNDSGGAPEVFSFSPDGGLIEAHGVTGAEAIDWEDIAAGPCPAGGHCLYLADIGDNKRKRTEVVVYLIEEPAAGAKTVPVLEKWTVRYPDGPHNAETLLVQPQTGRMRIVTKTKSGPVDVFLLPAEAGSGTMSHVGQLWDLPDKSSQHKVTGGDWSPDGSQVVLRTYDGAWEWSVDASDPDAHWGNAPRWLAPSTEEQGEAIAYRLGGGLITTSEGQPMPVHGISCDQP